MAWGWRHAVALRKGWVTPIVAVMAGCLLKSSVDMDVKFWFGMTYAEDAKRRPVI